MAQREAGDSGKSLAPEEQLRIATTLDFLGARRLLRNPELRPSQMSHYLQFSKQELLDYIASKPGLGHELLERSLAQRVDESAYILEIGGEFEVGRFSGDTGCSAQRRHTSIDFAATDFVLAFWGLPRD